MNNDRRKALGKLAEEARELAGKLSDLKDAIENLKGEEEEYKDNMPENLQQSEKYYAAEAAVDAMDSAISDLDGIDMDAIADYLDTAAE